MNEELKEDALDMLNIMVERIKTAAEAGEPHGWILITACIIGLIIMTGVIDK